MTDSHAHLDACGEPDAVVARALDAGVSRIVTIGTGIDSCRRALEIAGAHDVVVAALGIDPHRAATDEASRIAELRPLLEHPKAVAVGETGLDGHHGAGTLREQRILLDEHLALAESLGLPVVIHSRAASAAASMRSRSSLNPGTSWCSCGSRWRSTAAATWAWRRARAPGSR